MAAESAAALADRLARAEPGISDWIVGLRRHFHRFPEPGFSEHLTQQKLVEVLTGLGIEHRKAAGTGVIADVRGREAGPAVALRTDMDALRITEAETRFNRDYRSRHEGVMHACGHDGHMAMVLGAARLLQAHRAEWKGAVRLLFQPSEENLPGGARDIIRDGGLESVDAIVALHLLGLSESGEAQFRPGPYMAHTCDFNLTVTGKPGHHMNPQESIDPITIAARFVATAGDDVRTSLDPTDAHVLGFGTFHCGTQFNQTPEQATVSGSFRAFDEGVSERIEQAMRRNLDGLMLAFRKTGTRDLPRYDLRVQHGYPVLVNNPVFARRATEVLKAVFPRVRDDVRPNLGGEDFAYYLQRVPGIFVFIGAGNTAKGVTEFNHSPRFDIDEDVLMLGMRALLALALDFLGDPRPYLGT